jgi:hypothetical protein
MNNRTASARARLIDLTGKTSRFWIVREVGEASMRNVQSSICGHVLMHPLAMKVIPMGLAFMVLLAIPSGCSERVVDPPTMHSIRITGVVSGPDGTQVTLAWSRRTGHQQITDSFLDSVSLTGQDNDLIAAGGVATSPSAEDLSVSLSIAIDGKIAVERSATGKNYVDISVDCRIQ